MASAHRAVAAALGVACLLLLAVPALAHASAPPAPGPEAAELGLDVEVGYDGRVTGSVWQPVTVRLDPARALAASLVVESRSPSGVVRERRAIDVAARTPSAYRFLVPNGALAVSVAEPGRDAVTLRPRVEPDRRTYLVGVLGGVPPDPPALRHDPTALNGAWVGIDRAWLELSGQALDPLAALVAHASALEDLSDQARRNLAAGVAAGTDLVVVADRPGRLDDLAGLAVPGQADGEVLTPRDGAFVVRSDAVAGHGGGLAVAASQPAGGARVAVVATGPGAGAGDEGALWDTLLEPRQSVANQDWGRSADRDPRAFAGMFGDGGDDAPALPWLAVFAVAYVVVVGPVNAFVVARLGRRELAWVTVPIVTVTFTVAAFLGVAGGRPPVGEVGRALVSVDGTTTEMVAAHVRAPTQGERTIRLDGAGWTARPLVDGGRAAVVERGDAAVAAAFDLQALQPGGLVAHRAVADPPPLTVQASQGHDGVLAVAVTNTGGVSLDGVTVRAAGSTSWIGALDPGVTESVDIGGGSLPVTDPWHDPGQGLPQRLPDSLLALLVDDALDGTPGVVWVTGTRGPAGTDPSVTIGGSGARDRGALVAVGVTPQVEAGAGPGPFAVRRDAVAPDARFRPGPQAVEDASEAYLRFRFPPGTRLGVLHADLARGHGNPQLAVWVPGAREWRPVADAFPDGRGDAAALLTATGTLWVRATGDLFPFDYSGRTVHGIGGDA